MASDRIPKACLHKSSGRAVVRLNGTDHYLGKYGSRQAKDAYEELIARWLAGGRNLTDPEVGLTVNDLILAFVKRCETYYHGGDQSSELQCINSALSVLKGLWGRTPAAELGPKRLKAVRDKMLAAGWCRRYVNQQVDRVRRMFRWAVEEEMVAGDVYHALQAVKGIRRGMPDVRESEPVKPAAQAWVDAALPHMPPPVAAMVRLQLLTGMRPGEACAMRTCYLDTTGKVWIYRPASHKTAHHGKSREVFIGPKAQEVVRPWLRLETQAPLFSPAEAEAVRAAKRRSERKTPLYPSHLKRLAAKRKRSPKRTASDRYDVGSYRRAITRACVAANVPEWHPHQLRHSAATNLRKAYGIELARIVLGHSNLTVTEIYAEADQQQAIAAIAAIG